MGYNLASIDRMLTKSIYCVHTSVLSKPQKANLESHAGGFVLNIEISTCIIGLFRICQSPQNVSVNGSTWSNKQLPRESVLTQMRLQNYEYFLFFTRSYFHSKGMGSNESRKLPQ